MTEADLQQAICAAIRREYPAVWIDQNPLSELQFPGPKAYKFRLIADLKRRGWEPGRPDMVVILAGRAYAMEVKLPKENPFRVTSGAPWIEKTKDLKKKLHVSRQIAYLQRIHNAGFVFAGFVISVRGALDVMKGNLGQFGSVGNVYFER